MCIIFWMLFAFFLFFGYPLESARQAERGNVVLVNVDDLGQRDLCTYGNTFHETLNADRLAREGVKFVNAYASSPVCSPTRASIFTRLDPVRTVVAFVSDNRPLSTLPRKHGPACAPPFRAGKGWPYEGGIRLPFIIKAPGLKPGKTTAAPAITTDLYPTLVELAGGRLPEAKPLDGQSLVSVLLGNQAPRRTLYFHYPHYSPQSPRPSSAIRLGKWKLIENFGGELELYRLDEDIGEALNLASEKRGLALQLRERLDRWRAETGALTPSPNPLKSY